MDFEIKWILHNMEPVMSALSLNGLKAEPKCVHCHNSYKILSIQYSILYPPPSAPF